MERNSSNVISKVLSQEIDPNSYDILEKLKEKNDLESIAYKLVSMLNPKQSVQGANIIGKSEKEIKKLFQNLKNEKRDRRRKRRGKREKNYKRADRTQKDW